MKVYILNSFTNSKLGGNGLGLVLNEDLTDDRMLEIAGIVGYSETAFLKKINEKEYDIRYFTPVEEVDLCGHATIGAFSYLKEEKLIKKGDYLLNTKAGKIRINVDKIITMTQTLPVFYEKIETDEFLPCFYNLKKEDLIENAPIQIVSTGLKDIIAPIKNLDVLLNLKPNFNEISKLSEKYNTIGAHIFTTETKFNSSAHVRNFAPLYGIDEESATGTANGALACYLYKYFKEDIFNKEFNFNEMVFEQGYSMQRPSCIFAKLELKNDVINTVYVGGNAVFIESIEV